jgi:hypothetical protein
VGTANLVAPCKVLITLTLTVTQKGGVRIFPEFGILATGCQAAAVPGRPYFSSPDANVSLTRAPLNSPASTW